MDNIIGASRTQGIREEQLDHRPTNEQFLRRTGLLVEQSWSWYNCAVVLMLLSGAVHYFAKILFELEYLDLLSTVKSLHLASIYFLICNNAFSVQSGSQEYIQLKTIIEQGFKFYRDPLSEAQRAVKLDTNRRIARLRKIFVFIYVFALISSILREEVPRNGDFESWRQNYPGWFPISINSWPRYVMSQVYHVTIAVALDACSCTFFTTFLTLAEHVCCQLKLLIMALDDAFDAQQSSHVPHQLQARLVCCIRHHIEILRCVDLLQKYYRQILFTALTGASVVLCTMAYILTDPSTSFSTALSLLALGVPEVTLSIFYCINGQNITDLTDIFREAVYHNSHWYKQPFNIRFYILMILTRTKKSLTLNAGNVNYCNLEGYKELLQGTWAYFNMLRAFRGKI